MIPQYLNHIVRCISSASATPSSSAGHIMLWFGVYHETGNVIETHEHTRDFKE